jgi:hypothetical protein
MKQSDVLNQISDGGMGGETEGTTFLLQVSDVK